MTALLEVTNLEAWYGESQALHGVDLKVGEGEMITILGRNGVGKTTTLRTIMGMIRNRKGSIRLAGSGCGWPLNATMRLSPRVERSGDQLLSPASWMNR